MERSITDAILRRVRSGNNNVRILALVVAVFVLAGVLLLVRTHAATTSVPVEAENGVVAGKAAVVTSGSGFSGAGSVAFGGGTPTGTKPTTSKPCGVMSAPAKYKHVIWIWEENKDDGQVSGNDAAPYISSLQNICGSADNILDDVADPGLPSMPSYIAATSGSNCRADGSGCITSNEDGQSIDTVSIFELAKNSGGSWKSYQEGMQSSCANGSSGRYAFKHNPAAAYSRISGDCKTYDISIPSINCSDSSCGNPSGALVDDIAAGTLPTFSFITPNLDNDMHDGSIQQGDSWVKTYLPLIINGPNYQAGDTAVMVMWDEGVSNSAGVKAIPSVFIAPAIPAGTKVSTATNNIGILKTTQEMLGLTPLLGCAAGGNGCNGHSSVSLKAALHL